MVLNLLLDWIQGLIPFKVMLLELILSLTALLLVFPVHETAHGLMALAFGDKTAKHQKRLTLNPLAHIDLRGFLFLLILGFGWAKPVQFNPVYFKNRRLGIAMTAAAGPLANLLFCFLSLFVYGVFNYYAIIYNNAFLLALATLFSYIVIYNAAFAVFNLIPFPPLDGSKILGEMLPLRTRLKYYQLEQYSFFFFIALIILLNRVNVLGYLSNAIINGFLPIVNAVLGGIL